MDPETQQYLDLARTGLDTANKTGLLKGILSRIPYKNSKESPAAVADFDQRALLALKENAVEYFATLELTTSLARTILEPNFTLDDIDIVEPTWQKHWTEGASKVGMSDDDRITWWARLLAGEIREPGTFSLRTLAVMDTLSTEEARLFARVCNYVWNPTKPCLIIPQDESANWKPDLGEGTTLENAGLAKFDPLGGFNVVNVNARGTMVFHNDVFTISDAAGKSPKLRCGPLLLTEVGREMFRLTTPIYTQSYRDEIVAEWRETYTVHELPIAHRQDSQSG